MATKLWRPPIPLRLLFAAFTLLSAILVLQKYVGFTYSSGDEASFDWLFSGLSTLSSLLLWPLLSPLIYRVSRPLRRRQRPRFGGVSIHLLLSVIISLFHRVSAALLLYSVYFAIEGHWYGQFDAHTYSSIFVNVFTSFLIYWVLVGSFVAVESYQELQRQRIDMVRMENDLNNAELQALRMQLQPHFLFNTLHTISSLMDESVERAQTMISQMGFLLRGLLEQDHRVMITLEDEMKYIRSYLDIEQTRFRDRLSVRYDIADDTLGALVPSLILQPLVENAIKHGFSRRTDSGTIRVSSQRRDGNLELVVEDNGHGVGDVRTILASSGIGLRNVRKRLQQKYRERGVLRCDSVDRTGFVAAIMIPLEIDDAMDASR